ncbi:unnamed protein product [Acanthoscelides obtectus]|uniref:Uncharacterized protein n=1 Tax=Acanthoscelides obtectus TaxID=200917 RepID=A0A9P0PXV7_ACAOB|nr:unnamed protein product [Acanthoscelides obtectus]CAK1668441.1 hypothetical protein AOBTE_LOCUS26394 [Acanthoscelides obtectus]
MSESNLQPINILLYLGVQILAYQQNQKEVVQGNE